MVLASTSQNYELIKILNRVQGYSVRKQYTYNQMEGINTKPALQRGGENLLEYNLTLPLHINFCNPEEWINIIKSQAKSGNAFDWVYNGKYMGQFVIDSVEENIIQRINNIIVYAELTFNLLENPVDTVFKEQITNNQELSAEQYPENSNKVKTFLNNAKETVKNNLKDAVATSLVSDNLADAAKEIVSSSFEEIINDAGGGNFTSIFQKTHDIAERVMQSKVINLSDLRDINSMLDELPKKSMTTILRGGGTT